MFAPCVHKFSRNVGELLDTYFVDPMDVLSQSCFASELLLLMKMAKAAWAIQLKGYDRALRVALNARNELYVLDAERGRVHKFGADGEKVTTFGRYGAGDGRI